MKAKDRKATLALCRSLAYTIENAACAVWSNREVLELLDIARTQERQHRALGRRMVGNIGMRASVNATADMFLCRCIADAPRYRKASDLSGLRADYVKAVQIWHSRGFRKSFAKLLAMRSHGPKTVRAFRAWASTLDYVELCTEGSKA